MIVVLRCETGELPELEAGDQITFDRSGRTAVVLEAITEGDFTHLRVAIPAADPRFPLSCVSPGGV